MSAPLSRDRQATNLPSTTSPRASTKVCQRCRMYKKKFPISTGGFACTVYWDLGFPDLLDVLCCVVLELWIFWEVRMVHTCKRCLLPLATWDACRDRK